MTGSPCCIVEVDRTVEDNVTKRMCIYIYIYMTGSPCYTVEVDRTL